MEVKRERCPYCVVLDFMVHYFENEGRWDVDIKDTFDIYTKTIISLGSKSTLGSTTKKLEFGDDKKLDLVRTNVSFYYGSSPGRGRCRNFSNFSEKAPRTSCIAAVYDNITNICLYIQ